MGEKEKVEKKQYCVTLDKKEHDDAESKIENTGGKISTLLNNLLKKFNRGWDLSKQ